MEYPSERVRQLLDRADVGDLVIGITRCLDSKDFDGLGRLYVPDAVLSMPGTRCTGVEDIAAAARRNHENFWQTQHLVAGTTVSIVRDRAEAVSNVVAVLVPTAGGAGTRMMGCRYKLSATRSASGWAVAEHVIVPLWDLLNP